MIRVELDLIEELRLRRWARETGRKELLDVLEGKTPALPGGGK